MNILARYKNSQGKVYKYLCQDTGISAKKCFTPEEVLFLYKAGVIENVDFVPNRGYVAKSGSYIDTVCDFGDVALAPKSLESRSEVSYFDRGLIKACREIRECILKVETVVNTTTHSANHGWNIQLFRLIEVCGINITSFVKGYLSVLQPFELTLCTSVGVDVPSRNDIWTLELGYDADLLIKLCNTNSKSPEVVSFHESNSDGVLYKTPVDFTLKPCAVIVSDLPVKDPSTGLYHVNFVVQRGFERLSLSADTEYYQDGVALVDYNIIQEAFKKTIRSRLQELSEYYYPESNIDEVQNKMNDLVSLNSLSFSAYGHSTMNDICLLLDLYMQFKEDTTVRSVVVNIVRDLVLEIPPEKREALMTAISNRCVSQNKLLKLLNNIL